jgi:hypothetical protein
MSNSHVHYIPNQVNTPATSNIFTLDLVTSFGIPNYTAQAI